MIHSTVARRRFLRGAAAAAAVASLPARDDPIRFGMLGVGKRGNAHLGRLAERSDVRIQAVCDIDSSARDAAQSAAQADNPRSYSDFREMVRQDDIDAVLVATPCHLHAEMAALALEAGKHVFCEKPLAITADQVRLVLDAARNSEAVFQIGQQSRNSPLMQQVVR